MNRTEPINLPYSFVSIDILTATYNVYTNEVSCPGLKIFLPSFDVLPLDPLATTTYLLHEQGLINLANPGFDVCFINLHRLLKEKKKQCSNIFLIRTGFKSPKNM